MTSLPAGPASEPLPPVPSSFFWTTETWGSALRCRPLGLVARHLFTTRQLPLTEPADTQSLGGALGVDRVVMVTQVHKAGVLVVRAGDTPLTSRPEADVIVSNDPAVAVAVRAADCAPILLADSVRGAVAAVHAGWRGTAAGAVRIAVQALGHEFGCRPADLVAAIGPCIGSCCYEVGSELVDAFAAAGFERALIDRWFLSPPLPRGERSGPRPIFLDIAGANRDQLILAGVGEANVHLSGLCTAMNLGVFPSFRAEQQHAGRIAGAIAARGSVSYP